MTTHEEKHPFDALILDLDGVVTRTVGVHRIAWKETFDAFLRREHPDEPEFDADADYRRFVDGKPRLDGVRGFLGSRGIEIPEGDEGDSVEDGTVRGIGNSKNRRFHEFLGERGAEVFDDAVERVRAWRSAGVPVAVVSSSRNCGAILSSVGLTDLFDARVDGRALDELGLPGKPSPDMYLEAARRLGADPARSVVFEDALAGVEAARRGGFGLVVGVDRDGEHAGGLREHGADVVVSSLSELDLETVGRRFAVPLLLDRLGEFRERLGGREPALFLDYDGTLTPIVQRPELARLDERMRDLLREVASAFTVAIVSGRDREDVQELVGLDSVVYAGSHGYDIRGPEGVRVEHEVGEDALPALKRAEDHLRVALDPIEGAQIERKRFSIAVHYRNVADENVAKVEHAVDEAVGASGELRKTYGKKVFEVQPNVEWDKGRAVRWLIEALGLDPRATIPVYIGDDETDEDAFRALRGRGLGVLVAEEPVPSEAVYRLRDVEEVRRFLRWLASERNEELRESA